MLARGGRLRSSGADPGAAESLPPRLGRVSKVFFFCGPCYGPCWILVGSVFWAPILCVFIWLYSSLKELYKSHEPQSKDFWEPPLQEAPGALELRLLGVPDAFQKGASTQL